MYYLYTIIYSVSTVLFIFLKSFFRQSGESKQQASNVHVAYTTDLRVQSAKYNVHKDSYYRLAKCKSVAAQSIITGAQMLEAFKAVWSYESHTGYLFSTILLSG